MIHQALSPGGVDWLPPLILLCIIHGGQFTGGVHPPNQFVPEIVSPLPCPSALVRHTLLIVNFFKELISFIGSLDKCHTSVFKALICSVKSGWGVAMNVIQWYAFFAGSYGSKLLTFSKLSASP